MAVAFDNATEAGTTSSSSLTYSHTTTTNADRVLLVHMSQWDSTANPSFTDVTYNGTTLTQVGSTLESASSPPVQKRLLKLLDPDTGANNVVVTLGDTSDEINSMALTADTADDVGTPSTDNQETVTSISATVSGTTNGSLMADFADIFDNDTGSGYAADGSQTERLSVDNGVTRQSQFCSTLATTGGDQTLGWSWSGTTFSETIFVIEIKEPAAGANPKGVFGGLVLRGPFGGPFG